MLSCKIVIFIILLDLGIPSATYRSPHKLAGTWYVVGITGSRIDVKEPRCWIVEVKVDSLLNYIEGTSTFIDEKTNASIIETFTAHILTELGLQYSISFKGIYRNEIKNSGDVEVFLYSDTSMVLVSLEETLFSTLYLDRDSTAREKSPITYVNNTGCPSNEVKTTEKPVVPVEKIVEPLVTTPTKAVKPPGTTPTRAVEPPGTTPTKAVKPPGTTSTTAVKTTTLINDVYSSPTTLTELSYHNIPDTSDESSLMSYNEYDWPNTHWPVSQISKTYCSFISKFIVFLSLAQWFFL